MSRRRVTGGRQSGVTLIEPGGLFYTGRPNHTPLITHHSLLALPTSPRWNGTRPPPFGPAGGEQPRDGRARRSYRTHSARLADAGERARPTFLWWRDRTLDPRVTSSLPRAAL